MSVSGGPRGRAARIVRSVAVASLAVLTVAGCGVRLEATPQAIPPNVIPAPIPVPSPSPEPSASPEPSLTQQPSPPPAVQTLRLWFVREDGLVAVESALPVGTLPADILQALAVGPTAEEAEAGLRTVARDPLTGLALVSAAPLTFTPPATVPPATPTTPVVPTASGSAVPILTPEPASVTVQVSPAFSALPPGEQVALLGQVVLSLTGAGERSVAVTDEAGTPLAVPLPDGRLLVGPATARDYASLITQP